MSKLWKTCPCHLCVVGSCEGLPAVAWWIHDPLFDEAKTYEGLSAGVSVNDDFGIAGYVYFNDKKLVDFSLESPGEASVATVKTQVLSWLAAKVLREPAAFMQ